MSVCINLPTELEASLRSQISDLDQTAKEALLADLYRQGALTHFELGTTLGMERFEVDQFLNDRGVVEDLPTAESILREVKEVEARLQR